MQAYKYSTECGHTEPQTSRVDPKRLRRRMVRQLEAQGISDPNVLKAMAAVPRHLFIQDALEAQAYQDAPIPIGCGQSISQPYIVALMSELLEVRQGLRVLEVGTGSGYQAAVLAALGCTVFTIERLRELYLNASALLRQMPFRGIYTHLGDGTLGMPDAAPFERIIVTAGGPETPQPLLDQLEEGGILLVPVGMRPRQYLMRLRKLQGRVESETLEPVIFVDLIGDHGW